MSRTIETIIENYITGNLKDAKRLAKRTSEHMIVEALCAEYGKGVAEATYIASQIKGGNWLKIGGGIYWKPKHKEKGKA